MKATYEINFAKKTVFMSEVFVKKAGCFDTAEFHLRRQMRDALPDFEFRMFEDEGNENGRSHGKLTYNVMRDHIKGTESEENVKKVLEELEIVIAHSKVHRASYLFVKRWFFKAQRKPRNSNPASKTNKPASAETAKETTIIKTIHTRRGQLKPREPPLFLLREFFSGLYPCFIMFFRFPSSKF